MFDYNEDWKVIPLDDGRDYYWTLYLEEPDKPNSGGWLRYHEESKTLLDKNRGQYYEATIYTQRFLPKYVFHGGNYTMVSIDTHTDGNKFLIVLDNDKEIKDPEPYKAFGFPEGFDVWNDDPDSI